MHTAELCFTMVCLNGLPLPNLFTDAYFNIVYGGLVFLCGGLNNHSPNFFKHAQLLFILTLKDIVYGRPVFIHASCV